MKIIATTLQGLEPVLAQELEDLFLSNIKIGLRAVECEGNWSQLYKCNYQLRTAIRVLMHLDEFEILEQKDLYDALRTIDWSKYIKAKNTIAIKGSFSGELFHNTHYALLLAKDAIVDQLREDKGFRPSVNIKNPDILINLRITGNKLSLALDTSGQSLHLRNYRYRSYKAPLNEVLAAGLIKLSGWDLKTPFRDVMCGSGTFITEALMLAANIPSGQFVYRFGFEKWPEFHKEIWLKIKASGTEAIHEPEVEIIGSDINPYAVRDVKKNLQKLKFNKSVRLFEKDFFETSADRSMHLITNPPYDVRIEVENILDFYKHIGDHLKSQYQGSEAWIFTGSLDAMKSFGLHASKKYTLDNGGIESKLYKFELYKGSKKSKYKSTEEE